MERQRQHENHQHESDPHKQQLKHTHHTSTTQKLKQNQNQSEHEAALLPLVHTDIGRGESKEERQSPKRAGRTKIDKKKGLKVFHLLHETFVPGVPKDVTDWLALRRSYFRERDSAKKFETIASEIEYKSPYYWSTQIEKVLNGNSKNNHSNASGASLAVSEVSARPNKNIQQHPQQQQQQQQQLSPLQEFEEMLRNRQYHNNTNTDAAIMLHAINARHCRFIELAMQAGVDIDCRIDSMNRTGLQVAAFRGELKKVQLLLSYNANINVTDKRNNTALHLCLRLLPEAFKIERLCKYLLENGADVHCRNDKQQIPLHLACIIGDLRLIDPLLQAGSDVFSLDCNQKLPLQYCKKQADSIYIFACHENPGWKRSRHNLMWSHILAREFVAHVFKEVEPACIKCRRKYSQCALLKATNLRLWLLVHEVNMI